jgi:hypothetical protein
LRQGRLEGPAEGGVLKPVTRQDLAVGEKGGQESFVLLAG